MTYIEYSVRERVGYITLNRAEKGNALSFELVSELKTAFLLAEDDEGVKVIVLKANGDSFCAGADLEFLQQLQQLSFEQNVADSMHLKELFLLIYQLKKIVIAQVQGHALAGGCGLATVCDFVYAVPEAKFGYTEVRIGFIPAIVTVFLIRRIGEGRAKQLLLSGSLITASLAKEMNLINEVVPPDQLSKTVDQFAKELIVSNSGNSMALTKQLIAKIQPLPLDGALTVAAEMNARVRESDDCRKGIQAFLNKEKIQW